jgi:8-oxo-dGTP diphosphatase
MTPPSAAGSGSPSRSTDALLARFPVLHPPASTARAAVTIVLRDGASDVEALLIERAVRPEDPASGDVALPGGHVDEADGSLATTALRELREEVGVSASDLDGPLRFVGSNLARRFGIQVGVFAARLAERAGPPTIGDPEEVAHVFWLPSRALAESRLLNRDTSKGPVKIRATVHEGHVVWGFTRRVLREFFELPEEDTPLGPAFSDRKAEEHAPPASDTPGPSP